VKRICAISGGVFEALVSGAARCKDCYLEQEGLMDSGLDQGGERNAGGV